MDSLEIGKTKYIELRRILLTEGFKLLVDIIVSPFTVQTYVLQPRFT